MTQSTAKPCQASHVSKTSIVLPPDTNNRGTLFGGKMVAYVDEVASISAMRHARSAVVTAFIDSVEFLCPVSIGQAVTLESFVSWTGRTSIEVYVKVVAEDMITGEVKQCLTSLLVFVALDEQGVPIPVPQVIPETVFEQQIYAGGEERAKRRRQRQALLQDLTHE